MPTAQDPYVFSLLQHAQAYAHLGLSPIPLPFRGKRPSFPNWQKTTPQSGLMLVQQEVQKGQPFNLGIVTGQACVALDFDKKPATEEGLPVDGFENFLHWCDSLRQPKAWLGENVPYAVTGGGGLHFLFRMPQGIKIPTRAKVFGIEGFDVRGTGGQIVVQPSQHGETSQHYEWKLAPWQVPELPPLPPWLVEALSGSTKPAPAPIRRDATPDKETFENRVSALARKRSFPADSRKARQVLQLFEGNAIAEDGGGHDAFLGVTELLGRLWPHADPEQLIEYVRDGIESRIVLGRKTSVAEVRRYLEGAQSKYAAELEERNSTWRGDLAFAEDGLTIKATPVNTLIVLREHDDWQGVFGLNVRSNEAVFLREPPFKREGSVIPRAIDDTDAANIQTWFHDVEHANMKAIDVERAVDLIAKENSFDPVADWLLSLRWDGIRRLDRWITDYMGAEDCELHREFAKRWLIAGVARAIPRDNDPNTGPGCKVDTMLVAIGKQGIGKSSSFRALVPDPKWFTDHLSSLSTKDAKQEIHGPLIVEVAELQALRKLKDQEDAKSFLTIQYDRFRPAYGRRPKMFARRNIFCGTTNEKEPFRDASGARRYWPFECVRPCNPVGLARMRDQLWAEAVYLYQVEKQSWWLDTRVEGMAKEVQEQRTERPVYVHDIISAWLEKRPEMLFVTAIDLVEDALGMTGAQEASRLGRQIKETMDSLGWEKCRIRCKGEKLRGWIRPGVDAERAREWRVVQTEVRKIKKHDPFMN